MKLRNCVGLDDCFKSRLLSTGITSDVTSGFRSIVDNKRVGGVSSSAHLKGLAVDYLCVNSVDRFFIVKALLGSGFNRIGIYNDHVHVDCSLSLPQNVLFKEAV